MQDKRIFLVLVIFAVFILAAVLFGAELYQASQPPFSSATPRVLYVLKEHNGKIALFLPDKATPAEIYPDPFVRDLPEADREMLQNGVSIYSEAQLNNLIADLCS